MEQQEFNRNLGEKIRHFRTEVRSISQAEFAERVELSRPSIVNIEKGRQQVSCYQLVMFALALGISPLQLLGEETAADTNSTGKIDNSSIPEHFQEWFRNVQ